MSSNVVPINYRPQSTSQFIYSYLAEKMMDHPNIEIELRVG